MHRWSSLSALLSHSHIGKPLHSYSPFTNHFWCKDDAGFERNKKCSDWLLCQPVMFNLQQSGPSGKWCWEKAAKTLTLNNNAFYTVKWSEPHDIRGHAVTVMIEIGNGPGFLLGTYSWNWTWMVKVLFTSLYCYFVSCLSSPHKGRRPGRGREMDRDWKQCKRER